MSDHDDDPTRPSDRPAQRPQDRLPEEKLRLVLEACQLDDDELGEFLRREGLHEAQLQEWMATALDALGTRKRRRAGSKDKKRLRQLERELARKEKALAEASALLVLRGKLQALWGEEGDDTTRS